jgi:hypothetical protein
VRAEWSVSDPRHYRNEPLRDELLASFHWVEVTVR